MPTGVYDHSSLKKRKYRICPICDKQFWVANWCIKIGKGIYDSKECFYQDMRNGKPNKGHFKKGHFVPDEWRKKMNQKGNHRSPKSEFKVGDIMAEETKEKIKNTLKGTTHPPKTIEKRRQSLIKHWDEKGRKQYSRPKHQNWQYNQWRKKVFTRDEFVCQKSGQKGGYLQAHHIYNFAEYPELRFNVDNGITFSKEHHNLFHKIYGRKNNNQKQLDEFLNS